MSSAAPSSKSHPFLDRRNQKMKKFLHRHHQWPGRLHHLGRRHRPGGFRLNHRSAGHPS
ncbi:hypothetical protein WP1_112 [Pseudomonas phage WP1]